MHAQCVEKGVLNEDINSSQKSNRYISVSHPSETDTFPLQ